MKPSMNMTPNGKGKRGRQSGSMRHLKTMTIVSMIAFLTTRAFGSGLKLDLQKAESRYERDSESSEPRARRELIKSASPDQGDGRGEA